MHNFEATNRNLGYRGRYFNDVWDEEALSKKRKQLEVVGDWRALFNDYSESHDGHYRDWSIRITPTLRHRLRVEKQQVHTKILAPPVPSNLQHPASWGFRSRISPRKEAIDKQIFEKIHPACYSSTIVEPPAKQTNIISLIGEEDKDELQYQWREASAQLTRLEIENYLSLLKIESYADISSSMNELRKKRRKLNSIFNQAFEVSRPRLCGHETSVNKDTRKSLQIPHADFVISIQRGDVIEVSFGSKWTIVEVLKLRFDGQLLRHIKVL